PLAVEIDPDDGARLVSFSVQGEELLSTQPIPGEPDSLTRGCYPMVPWAGRIGHGVIEHAGEQHHLPTDAAGHALHGTGRDRAWNHVDDLTFEVELGAPWPVSGRATLHYELTDVSLRSTLTWTGAGPGASLGFHPWFRRHLSDGSSASLALQPHQ